MNDDYLWNGSGEPDAEIVRLEKLLGRYRWSSSEFVLARHRWRLWAAAAAILVMTATACLFLIKRQSVEVTVWKLSLAGREENAVRTGQVIETKLVRGTLRSDAVGEVEVEPHSRLRVISARADRQRMALEEGMIHAFTWAPPATFVVDTPSAKTVDLGCQYTLDVAKDGTGFLTVEMGWVAFEWHNMESFIPAGAACTTRPGHGPDTPHFLDAPQALVEAVAQFDSSGSDAPLKTALAAARSQDALTLWHLLQRTFGPERGEVFDRFRALVKLPPTVTREAILTGNRKAMDGAWDALQLGDTSWWRTWKREW